MDDTRADVRPTPTPSSSSTSPPRSGASARTARIPGATGSRTWRWARTSSSRRASTRRRSSSSSGPSAPIRSSRPSRSARTTSGTAIRRRRTRRTASRRRRCSSAPRRYREQYGLDAIFLLPTNLYGPRDNFDLETSHVIPALIRKMVEARRTRSCCGATARRRASSSTSTTASRASSSRPSATTGRTRSTSAPRARSRSATSRSSIAEVTGYDGHDRLGHGEAERPAATERRRLAAPASCSDSRRERRCARGSSEPSPGTARRSPVSVRS